MSDQHESAGPSESHNSQKSDESNGPGELGKLNEPSAAGELDAPRKSCKSSKTSNLGKPRNHNHNHKHKHKHKISLRTVLVSVLVCVVVLQGAMPLVALMNSGVKETLAQNEIELGRRMVENRQATLEGEMTSQWAGISREIDFMNSALAGYLQQDGATMQDFLADSSRQSAFVEKVFPELLSYSRRDSTCGAFLVLANAGNATDLSQPSSNIGVFLRDSEPTVKYDSNSDIKLERGSKALANQAGIALDDAWSPVLCFADAGTRACDDYFYQPYRAMQENPQYSAAELGYWSNPFILEDSRADTHRTVTYSIPLVSNGVVYGVMGIEVSCDYLLNTCFPSISSGGEGGYALAYQTDSGTYDMIESTGSLCDAIGGADGSFALEPADHDGFYHVCGVKTKNGQEIYAMVEPVRFYEDSAPYDANQWVVCGFVTQGSVYAAGDKLYSSVVVAILLCALGGLALVVLASYELTKPINRLMTSVRRGRDGIDSFHSGMAETEELHDVIKNLVDTEMETRARLNEEKERYRLAVESSSDTFFTVYEELHTVEIVGGKAYGGTWTLADFKDKLDDFCGAGDDWYNFVQEVIAQGEAREEYLMPLELGGEARWVEINARWIPPTLEGKSRIVGYLRDINDTKLQEIKDTRERTLDPATELYRYDVGMKLLRDARLRTPEGAMVLIDIAGFSDVVRRYGFSFGDVVLEEFAKVLVIRAEDECGSDAVVMRVGADEFVIWLPDCADARCMKLLRAWREDLASLVNRDILELRFRAGVVLAGANDLDKDLVEHARVALAQAKWLGAKEAFWAPGLDASVRPAPFGEIVSMGLARQIALPSLAVSLLDRRSSLVVGMDLLAHRLEDVYGFANLYITTYDADYAAARLMYLHHPVKGIDEASFVTRYTADEALRLQRFGDAGRLIALSSMPGASSGKTALIRNIDGIVFPMTSDGLYSGGVFFLGADMGLLSRKDDANELWEIASIIQNRMNQEHTDQAARAKADFLARMSHEIRTPMNGVIGMTDIALQPGQTEERRIECLQKVRASSHFLLDLLNDILDMTKIESGKMKLVAEPFSLDDVLSDLHSVLDERFAERNQTFTVEDDVSHRVVVGDAMRIKQVLINLLSNSIKYSDPGTQITLEMKERGFADGQVRIYFAVTDHGIGISEEDTKRIFVKFEQVNEGGAWQHGTGLGLSICSHLVRMMGSRINVESQLGRGSTFSFAVELPVGCAIEKVEAAAKPAVDFAGMQVLVAEDNSLNAEILCYMLEDFGCKVTCVADGQQALDAFKDSPRGFYQVVLMDVMMPVMNGLDAAHAIRMLARPDAQTVAIVAVSANAFAEDVQRSLASGMNAHISKPVEASKLAEVLARVAPKRA